MLGKTVIPMPPAMNTWEHDGPNCGGTRPRRAGGGGRPDGAPDHAPFRGPRPGRRGRATRWMCGRRARSPPTRSSALVARPEGRSGHDSEHLLLVVDGPAAVGGHRRRGVVRRDRVRVDVAVRDRKPEVVADEA